MTNEIQVYTPKDVARITKRSLRLIYKELRKGSIRHCKAGDLYLISDQSLAAWLAGEKNQPTGTASG